VEEASAIRQEALGDGVIFGRWGSSARVIKVKPPLIVSQAECDEIFDVFARTLQAVLRKSYGGLNRMAEWLTEVESQLREQMASIEWLDASAWLGRTSEFPLMEEGTPELLDRIHHDRHVCGALVSHWLSERDPSPEVNQRLLCAVSSRADWYAALTLHPLYPEDADSPASPEWVWHEKVKAVRVFPTSYNYPMVDWCVGSLCELLIERRLPLVVFHNQTSFRDLHDLAQVYPELRIVVESQTTKSIYHHRTVLPLMKACPNIFLEISNFCGPDMIKYTVDTLGPERLIFGTFAPAMDPLVPMGMLLQSGLDDEDKRAIAGGNIRRLISEVRS